MASADCGLPALWAQEFKRADIAALVLTAKEGDLDLDIAIVGGGFSGTVLAVQLLRHASRRISVALIERKDQIGRGVAYGACGGEHVLNVAAGKMSVFPDEPAHFTHWLATSRGVKDAAEAFLPRSLYGDYVEDTLQATLRDYPAAHLCRITGSVCSLKPCGPQIEIGVAGRESMLANTVVLATGNYPPPDPPEMKGVPSHLYVRYAWSQDALDSVDDSDGVLLLGSGLTAVDQVLALEKRGFRGTVHIVSSRGLLPRAHGPYALWAYDWTTRDFGTMRALLATVREQIALAAAQGKNWRAVLDSLRPHSQTIWKSLPLVEKRRFLRHVRPFWDVHRHRVALAVHEQLSELAGQHRLTVNAGRCLSVSEEEGRARVVFRRRGCFTEEILRVDKIINCTGPSSIARLVNDAFIDSLFRMGLARPDPLGMGLDTDESGRLIDAAGSCARSLFAIGPLRKGCLWETTAVAEIRNHAAALAKLLLGALDGA
jgi:uncharacterized NAD(P)/FAD-binding protein YdhS